MNVAGIRKVYTHGGCPDGRAAALIVQAALGHDVTIVEVDYGPELDALQPEPGLLFVDICPPGDPARWIEAGTIVLDHHVSRRAEIEYFAAAGLGVYGDTEAMQCGAWLAYEHIYNIPVMLPGLHKELADLAAVRDTWQKDHPLWKKACIQAEVLRFFPFEYLLKQGAWGVEKLVEEIGPVLLQRREESARYFASQVVTWKTHVGKVAVVPTTDVSDVAELLRDKCDLVAGFGYVGDQDDLAIRYSLRSSTVDCAAIARRYGGGGHKAAAGFQVSINDAWKDGWVAVLDHRNPYWVLNEKLYFHHWDEEQAKRKAGAGQ